MTTTSAPGARTADPARLSFVELDALDAPSEAIDWLRGVGAGLALGLIALAIT